MEEYNKLKCAANMSVGTNEHFTLEQNALGEINLHLFGENIESVVIKKGTVGLLIIYEKDNQITIRVASEAKEHHLNGKLYKPDSSVKAYSIKYENPI